MSLRIIHCLRAPVGGLFRHVRDLAAEQARQGYDVGVLCDATAKDGLTERHLTALGEHLALGLHRSPMSRAVGIGDFAAAQRTARLCQALQIDVVHGHGAKGGAYARLAAGKLQRRGHAIRAFYTPHGGSLHYPLSTLKGQAFMALERHLARRTDGIIFESAYAEARFAEKVGHVACPTCVIPNGVSDADFIAPIATADASDLLFIGELRQLKGVDILVKAHAVLAERRPVTLTIVGDGPDADLFRDLAAASRYGNMIRFAGARPAAEAFTLGRHLVVPSRAESLPYVVLEAAARGMPVIASHVGGIPEIVAGTDTDLVPPEDVSALARVIAERLEDPATTAAKAKRLRDAVRRRFTVAVMAAAITEFYGTIGAELAA